MKPSEKRWLWAGAIFWVGIFSFRIALYQGWLIEGTSPDARKAHAVSSEAWEVYMTSFSAKDKTVREDILRKARDLHKQAITLYPRQLNSLKKCVDISADLGEFQVAEKFAGKLIKFAGSEEHEKHELADFQYGFEFLGLRRLEEGDLTGSKDYLLKSSSLVGPNGYRGAIGYPLLYELLKIEERDAVIGFLKKQRVNTTRTHREWIDRWIKDIQMKKNPFAKW